jgi:hypothetical protein
LKFKRFQKKKIQEPYVHEVNAHCVNFQNGT